MRLTCPNCGARYEVDDALIPPEGRDVQCSDCATTWFQAGARRPASEPPAPRPPFPPSPDAGIDEAEAFAGSAVPDPAMAAEAEVERHGKPEPEAVSEPGPEPEPGPSMDEPEPEPVRYDEPGPEPEPEPHVEGPEITPVPEPGDLTATMVEARDEAPDDASDETLTEIPQSAESAMRVVAENDEPDAEASDKDEPHVEDEDAADTTPGTAGRRGIDPDVRDILRAEAEREARLRQAAHPVETQAEMPLDEAPQDAERARKRAEFADAEDAFTVAAASAAHAGGSRRDLLPDIEEINSTLRATEDRRDTGDGDEAVATDRADAARRRKGVRLGFFVTLAVTAGLIWVYVNADMLSRNVPAIGGAVEGFTTQVDGARYWLDALARRLAESGEGT